VYSPALGDFCDFSVKITQFQASLSFELHTLMIVEKNKKIGWAEKFWQ